MKAKAKAELKKKGHIAVIFRLGNKVLREVIEETTVAGVWTKLETLYMTKPLAYKIAETRRFHNLMRDEAQTAKSSTAQLSALIVELEAIEDGYEAEEKIARKEEHVKTMESLAMAAFLLLDKLADFSRLQDRMNLALSGARRDALKSLDYLREMVVRDSGMLGVLEQPLAGSHVGMPMKDGYVTDMQQME
ncbi:hypothetical protein Tco_1203286 [Tanacetum coccineum]